MSNRRIEPPRRRPEKVPGLILYEVRPGIYKCGANYRTDTAQGVNDYCPYELVVYLDGTVAVL